MRTRSPVRRIVLGLLALAHLSVPMLAAVAHARLARAQASDIAQVHVEDMGAHQSAPTHPESCVFCQLLGRFMWAGADQKLEAQGAVCAVAPLALREDVQLRTPAAQPSSRAPPAQS